MCDCCSGQRARGWARGEEMLRRRRAPPRAVAPFPPFQSGHITIWTDVDGVYSADPRKVPESVCLKQLRCVWWQESRCHIVSCSAWRGML